MKEKKILSFFEVIFISIVLIFSYTWIIDASFYLTNTVFDMIGINKTLDSDYYLFDTIGCIVMLPIYTVFYLYKKRDYLSSPKFIMHQNKKTTLYSFILDLGFGGISTLIIAFSNVILASVLPLIRESAESFEQTGEAIAQSPYIWSFLSVVLLGPIVEEILFRGIIFNELEKFKKGFFPIIISSILFGLFHQEPIQVFYTTAGGFALGLIYSRTRSLKLVIILHMLGNLFSVLPPFLDIEPVYSFINTVQITFIIPAIFLCFVFRPKKTALQEDETKQNTIDKTK